MISLLITLVVLGLILYLIKAAPIDQMFKNIATVVVIIFAILWLVRQFSIHL